MPEKPKALFLDLDGVVYEDESPLTGAADVFDYLNKNGIPFRCLTNTTIKTRSQIVAKLRGLGVRLAEDKIFSALYGVERYLWVKSAKNVFALLQEGVREEFPFSHDKTSKTDYVVVCDMEDAFNYSILNEAFSYIMEGAELVASHVNRFWKKDGQLLLDVGCFVKLLEYAADCSATLVGKPASSFFELALQDVDEIPGNVLMVGDDIESDISGAKSAGIKTALVRTGKFKESTLQKSDVKPDAIINTIGDLLCDNII